MKGLNKTKEDDPVFDGRRQAEEIEKNTGLLQRYSSSSTVPKQVGVFLQLCSSPSFFM